EHPLAGRIAEIVPAERGRAMASFAESLRSKSELERTSLMEKQGVFTGAYAVHPLSGQRVPIWMTNYVLAEYGTGAVMGVPAHDERDFDFARRNELPVVRAIAPENGEVRGDDVPYVEDGVLVDSGEYTGMTSERARDAIAERLTVLGAGEKTV